MKPTISHQMLVANAGSGKTHALTTRMITLLALGVQPRKIAALTFTKKAAGEFLDAVFLRLTNACKNPDALQKLRADTDIPDLQAEQCGIMLQRLVDDLGSLTMGTIDSLFARIARAFPFESGLTGEFAMLSDQGLEAARENALAELFKTHAKEPDGFAAFLDLVRQQSRKASERQVFSTLLESAKSLHGRILSTPAGVTWGDRAAIWPLGSAILSAGNPHHAADILRDAIFSTHPHLDPEAITTWEANLAIVKAWNPMTPWPQELDKFFTSRLCKESIDKSTGEEYMPTGSGKAKRVYLNDAVIAARDALRLALIRPVLEVLLHRSAALYELMHLFEFHYDRLTRRVGLLTFADITDLLAAQVELDEWRAVAGYRLDSRFDHWMLDEFQDTSRPQWKVLSSFVDEVVQDAGGERSLFYVGDTKQAIYSWRGGDPELFFEVCDRYNAGTQARISVGELEKSYRSTEEILDVVNRVFGHVKELAEPLGLSAKTAKKWQRAWRNHSAAIPNSDQRSGYVRWVSVADSDEEEGTPQDLEILKILREVEPWARGLSCAVLKSKNSEVADLAALLQAHGVPVAAEGKSNPCTDNPLGQALLAGLRCVASPQDSQAEIFLSGFPLGEALLRDGVEKFRGKALGCIASIGFAGTLNAWIGNLEGEDFLQSRAEEFLAAAREFDSSRKPSDGIFELLDFINAHQITETESPDVVRVMTVHQAKGLTFDMTIVSGLDGRTADHTTDSLFLGPKPSCPEWGMLLPKKDIAACDDVLADARALLTEEAEYGTLCTAYVAMTRPRFALYLLTNQLGKTSTAKHLGRMLSLTFDADSYELGSPKWYEARDFTFTKSSAPAEATPPLPPPVGSTPKAVSPSSLRGGPNQGSTKESSKESAPISSAAIGREVHLALSRILWLKDSDISFKTLSSQAGKLLNDFLKSDLAKTVFSEPEQPVTVLREQAFDVLMDNQWVSGVFDRVHLFLDDKGIPLSAVIYDFKTDAAGDLESRYRSQMNAYKSAAVRLFGLVENSVRVELVAVVQIQDR
jgi:ATP-dependent exoDNAse (exonuclease V) beta subunit